MVKEYVEDGPPSHTGGGDDMQSVVSYQSHHSHHSHQMLQTQGAQSYVSAATQGTQQQSPLPPPGMHEQEIEQEQVLSWGSMFGDVALVTNRNYFTTTVARGKFSVLFRTGHFCMF